MRNRFVVVAALLLMLVGAMPVCTAQDFGWEISLSNGEKFERVALAGVTNDSLMVTTSSNYSE